MFHTNNKKSALSEKWPPRMFIQPIMFLSQLLIDVKQNYWLTELEIAGFV